MARFSPFLYLTLVALAVGFVNAQAETEDLDLSFHHDVIILGGGSAGMNMAWNLKDNGYDVLVIENQDFIGGHCNTIRFTHDGEPFWIDAGVAVFPNTSLANTLGYGPWAVDVAGIIQRFAGPDSIVPSQFNGLQTFEADFSTGVYYGLTPPTFNVTEFGIALFTLNELMNTTFKFMDNMINIPSPIPAELLLTFEEWITLHNFHVLDYLFNGTINAGGFGPFNQVTAFDAVAQLGPTTLMFDLISDSWFGVKNGCLSIYEGIENYLGSNAIMLNAHVTHALRPPAELNLPIVLSGVQNGRPFIKTCDKLIVAYQQTLDKLAPLNLDARERAVFGSVTLRDYTTAKVLLEGPLTASAPYLFANVRRDQPLSQPALPNIYNFFNNHPFGPGFAIGFSETILPPGELDSIMIESSEGVPPEAFTSVTFEHFWRHEYNPHFSVGVLGAAVNPYTRLDNLQGHRNTFYCGALYDTETSGYIWNKNKVKLMPFFPPKAK